MGKQISETVIDLRWPIQQVQQGLRLTIGNQKQTLIKQRLLGGLAGAVEDEIRHRLVGGLGCASQHGLLIRRGAQPQTRRTWNDPAHEKPPA